MGPVGDRDSRTTCSPPGAHLARQAVGTVRERPGLRGSGGGGGGCSRLTTAPRGGNALCKVWRQRRRGKCFRHGELFRVVGRGAGGRAQEIRGTHGQVLGGQVLTVPGLFCRRLCLRRCQSPSQYPSTPNSSIYPSIHPRLCPCITNHHPSTFLATYQLHVLCTRHRFSLLSELSLSPLGRTLEMEQLRKTFFFFF